ncbi:type I polyketide synthase [Niabella beijingensis]|uniref:type I polyketide synthase n=1 Tax=Niabella beijingensis TaxID=2872700 RepID=UPI001CBB08B8|nr:type I polyketide synthase [Niabella beijingensis]MBZ4192502.1 SDR family NAD(P)-dependent oxidoreductase [Niabella beijingensis]
MHPKFPDEDLLIVSPCEIPDVRFALTVARAGAFPVVHLGRKKADIVTALDEMDRQERDNFGICLTTALPEDIRLPDNISVVIAPWSLHGQVSGTDPARLFYQVTALEEALQAKNAGAAALIVKGNESGGAVGEESAYILFQRVIAAVKDIPVYVQGGIGIHTAAAVKALGAAGVVLDSQVLLFRECNAPAIIKKIAEKLNGNETRVIDGYRVLVRPDSPVLPAAAAFADISPLLGNWELQTGFIPLGQDVALAAGLSARYKKMEHLVFAFHEAMHGHLVQAKALNVLCPGNTMAQALNIHYPVAQGPMTRVSDVPEFAAAVANAGALPFVALSLLKGQPARDLIRQTKALAGGKTWGVGILGFAPQELREEQLALIREERPPVVLIAGGRTSQSKPLEKMGIPVFLHVPSVVLLDLFLREGARRFVFEGRECGGHVGPLSSMVLWEKQIERLLQEDDLSDIHVFFAGGIHDALSAAFVAVMAAPLAARGAKLGVLMGTAYIFTHEAVQTGAVLEQFQQQAIAKKDTVLLETAPGHETRCLCSPFTDFFNQEKQRLIKEGWDKKEIWKQLEALNIGRLRIAAKGIERQDSNLVAVDATGQLDRGMYMIGQVTAMHHGTMSLRELHENVTEGSAAYLQSAALPILPVRTDKAVDIAIVGMACIYPGARDLDEYWRNIVTGTDSVTEVPDDRWNKALYFDPDSGAEGLSHSKWGGFIPRIDFDPLEFGIPPQSLAAIEPSQLLSLLVAKQALENAGYKDGDFNAENVSVILGAEGGNDLANSYGFRNYFKQVFGEMPEELDKALPKLTEDSFPGVLANVISGRITNRLNLGGRNYTVDAACASSLAAIDLACQELILEKSDMVLAGGVDLHNGINDYLMFSSTHALSRKGRCATFDAEADGIALGEGVAIVVLKRLKDAERDEDRIYAVIKGVGGSSDGKSLGLTAPRKTGQLSALGRAYEQAGISPAALGLLEAHGTGTVVGDRTELSALTDLLLNAGALPGQVHLGSVKTQIGHTKCAAGLAGLIKAALAVYHGVKPATIHLHQPNGYYAPSTSPFAFNAAAGIWTDAIRRAGVSAFGFGGTNFHAVLESNPAQEPAMPLPAWPVELFVFRGVTSGAAIQVMERVKKLLYANDTLSLKDLAYSLAVYNEAPVQFSIIAGSSVQLLERIEAARQGIAAEGVFSIDKKEGKVAFLFSGQGSQRINMARELFVAFPAMRCLLARHKKYEKILFPDAVFNEAARAAQQEAIKDTRNAQPLLGIVDLAIAEYLLSLGIVPDMVAGHSYGELPALCFAGVFDPEVLVDLSEKRAAAILNAVGADKGMMAAVSLPSAALQALIKDEKDIWAVNFNAPKQSVLAGTTAAMQQLMERMKEEKISFRQLEVACAFHSPLLAGAEDLFAAALQAVPFHSPQLTVWSNTTAGVYPAQPEAIRQQLAKHLVEPVKFTEEIEGMYAEGARIFIEAGPGKVLAGLTRSILNKDGLVLHTEDKDQGGIALLLKTIAAYLATGREVHLQQLFSNRNARLLKIDTPEAYRKSPALWYIDGQKALPASGTLPDHGALPIVQPLQLKTSTASMIQEPSSTDKMMLEYLNSMKMMIQAQRDVMMSYLGQPVMMPPAVPANRVPPPIPPASTVPAVVIPDITPAALPQPGAADVKAVLLEVVSDKTGYPNEMLGLEMDLEADLSIDSIKRMEIIGELRNRLGGFNTGGDAGEEMMEQLAAIKTLSGLISWINANTGQPEPESSVPAARALNRPVPDLRAVLLQTVSDKTGYPVEMLGLDLDLEADLSIDSIKRMEIIGALQGALGGDKAAGDDLMEQLAAIKTLNGLLGWLSKPGTTATPVEEAQQIINEGLTSGRKDSDNLISRLRFEIAAAQTAAGDPELIRGKLFAVTEDNGHMAAAVKQRLEEQGAVARVITMEDPLDLYDGLIIINAHESERCYSIMDAFALIKKLNPEKVSWIFTLSDLTGHMKQSGDITLLRRYQGFSGLMKSLDRELEQTCCRMISLQSVLDPAAFSTIVLNELLYADRPPEVLYQGTERFRYNLVSSHLTAKEGQTTLHLGKEAVVLVFGGAQGITAELTAGFAREYPCHYILVGRSPHPVGNNPYAALKTKDAIRKQLIEEGLLKAPSEIEKSVQELFKNNQILHAIKTLENNGATASYYSLDLRDEEGLRAFIQSVYREQGRIDGVIHGAGLLEDKLFLHKTAESFERVFTTKVTPLRVLVEELKEEVQFVIFFSSIASVYGNRGQTDYAAANSVMDRYTWALKERIKGRVTSINWGPWKGAGMVSPSLEKEYIKRGIAMIPLEDGLESFVNELKYGTESQVLIMAGDVW